MTTETRSTEHEHLAGTEPGPIAPHRSRWIGWTVVVGLALGIPAGWLLAYLAALPFLLGLFFFLLLGLIVGAAMYRVGAQSPPQSARTLCLLGSVVALVMFGVSLWAEYQALGRSVEKRVRQSYADSFTPEQRAELRQGVDAFVAAELRSNYPPGGFTGYLRWAAGSGRFDCPRILRTSTVEYRLPYRRTVWVVRVVLSLFLLEWAIVAQFLGLRPKTIGGTISDQPGAPPREA